MVYSTTVASSAHRVYSRRVTSVATTESTGFVPQRFLRAQRAVKARTPWNRCGATQENPPVYGAALSAVPWNAIIGTGRWSVHQLNGKKRAAPTIPTAAIRSDSVQESANDMPPPLDSPLA